MSELSNSNKIQEEAQASPLCVNCLQFFGNSSTENLCSKCYKDKCSTMKSQPASKAIDIQPAKTEESSGSSQKMTIEESKANDTKTDAQAAPTTELDKAVPLHQMDHTRCWKCNKKVGLLGFKCKCDSTYCKVHRLPEEHSCSYDFGRFGKERLARENVIIKADKLEKF